jgi:hypothetical protein
MGFAVADLIKGNGNNYARTAQQQEQQRQNAIAGGTADINKAFSGFTPTFYQQRAQAYQDFALPQLSQQYETNRNQVGFNLANRGVLRSGTANKQWSNLARDLGQAKQTIADQGISQAEQLQQGVETQRQNLISQLYQGADPANAGASAIQVAANASQPSTFAPLSNMFANLANQYYLGQVINAYRPTSYVSAPPTYSASPGAIPPITY